MVYVPGVAGAVSVEEPLPVEPAAENGTLGLGLNAVLLTTFGQLISVRLDPPPVNEETTVKVAPGATVMFPVLVVIRRFPPGRYDNLCSHRFHPDKQKLSKSR